MAERPYTFSAEEMGSLQAKFDMAQSALELAAKGNMSLVNIGLARVKEGAELLDQRITATEKPAVSKPEIKIPAVEGTGFLTRPY